MNSSPARLMTATGVPSGAGRTVRPSARRTCGVVRRAHDAVVAREERVDLPLAPHVVAGGEHVHAAGEQLQRDLRRDAGAVGGVLAVGDRRSRRRAPRDRPGATSAERPGPAGRRRRRRTGCACGLPLSEPRRKARRQVRSPAEDDPQRALGEPQQRAGEQADGDHAEGAEAHGPHHAGLAGRARASRPAAPRGRRTCPGRTRRVAAGGGEHGARHRGAGRSACRPRAAAPAAAGSDASRKYMNHTTRR